jgi:hypothetical protein
MKSTSLIKEYIIDKKHIYKNTYQDLKDLLKENEKIHIVTSPEYVPYAFQVAKELHSKGLSTYDEDLKIERDFKSSKRKTKIYISIKRKPKIFEYLIGKEYFHKNIFTEIKNYLDKNNKVTIVAKTEEVGIAFKVANELVKKGIAYYDEELKLHRNFKEGQGNTKVIISLKKRAKIKSDKKEPQKDVSNLKIIQTQYSNIINHSQKKEKVEIEIKKDSSYEKIVSNIRDLLNEYNKIKLIANKDNVGLAFTAVEALIKKKEITYDEELYVKHEIQEGKGRAKIFISIKKKI